MGAKPLHTSSYSWALGLNTRVSTYCSGDKRDVRIRSWNHVCSGLGHDGSAPSLPSRLRRMWRLVRRLASPPSSRLARSSRRLAWPPWRLARRPLRCPSDVRSRPGSVVARWRALDVASHSGHAGPGEGHPGGARGPHGVDAGASRGVSRQSARHRGGASRRELRCRGDGRALRPPRRSADRGAQGGDGGPRPYPRRARRYAALAELLGRG